RGSRGASRDHAGNRLQRDEPARGVRGAARAKRHRPPYRRTPPRGPPRPQSRRSRTVSLTDFLKKDLSFKRKPSPNAEAAAPTQEKAEKNEPPKPPVSLPKSAPQQA